MKRYVDAAKIGKTGACHLFRHAMATHMLEGGADVRLIQEMLGHAETSTTAIYARVSIRHLKAVHDRTHPAAHLETRHRQGGRSTDVAGELLAALDGEAEEDDDERGRA